MKSYRRTKLIADLRRESNLASERRITPNFTDTPLLAGLVVAAYAQPKRPWVTYRGVAFPVRNSWCRNVCCPETKMPLVGISGGWLV